VRSRILRGIAADAAWIALRARLHQGRAAVQVRGLHGGPGLTGRPWPARQAREDGACRWPVA
jgi:hypothetical protein